MPALDISRIYFIIHITYERTFSDTYRAVVNQHTPARIHSISGRKSQFLELPFLAQKRC